MVGAIVRHVRKGKIEPFMAQGDGCGWCRRPVRLRGRLTIVDGDERRLRFSSRTLPDGVLLKACGSLWETVCPACATVYRDDARHLVRAGLVGGKGVDESITAHPAVLLTLTAPGFGAVHTAKDGNACRPMPAPTRCRHERPLGCRLHHREGDDVVGTPLCSDCYDYEGAVLQNACTSELWRRTTIYVHRQLASVLGLTQAETKRQVRLSFCRVAEYQHRGVVHLHAVIRADAPDSSPPPVTDDRLAMACLRAARAVTVPHPRGTARWGTEVDAQVLDRANGRAKKVAGYVAKYATMSSESSGVPDHPIRSAGDLDRRELDPHIRRMVETAWRLGADPVFADLGLRRHAHTSATAATSSRSPGSTRRRSAPCGRPGPSGGPAGATACCPGTVRWKPAGSWSASAGPTRARRGSPTGSDCGGPRSTRPTTRTATRGGWRPSTDWCGRSGILAFCDQQNSR